VERLRNVDALPIALAAQALGVSRSTLKRWRRQMARGLERHPTDSELDDPLNRSGNDVVTADAGAGRQGHQLGGSADITAPNEHLAWFFTET
jgi:hypothetical protein